MKKKIEEYEYDESLEPSYMSSMLKLFNKTLSDGYFSMILVDSVSSKVFDIINLISAWMIANLIFISSLSLSLSFIILLQISDFDQFWSKAKLNGFEAFVVELKEPVDVCVKRNTHNRTREEIEKVI